MAKRVREQRERVRELSGRGYLPVFEVSDYVLMARVRKPCRAPKLVQTWTGPLRVVPGGSEHVYLVEDIVTGETKEVVVVVNSHSQLIVLATEETTVRQQVSQRPIQ